MKWHIIVALLITFLIIGGVIFIVLEFEADKSEFCFENGYKPDLLIGTLKCYKVGEGNVLETRDFTRFDGKYYWENPK